MPDHIHMLVHPDLKKELWGGHLWNPSYCAVTVSDRSREQVSAYIKGQKEKEKRKKRERKEKALSTGIGSETFVLRKRGEEDADSIQLWRGDTKTEYPDPSDNGYLSPGSRLPDRDLRTGLGRTEEDSGDKKAF